MMLPKTLASEISMLADSVVLLTGRKGIRWFAYLIYILKKPRI